MSSDTFTVRVARVKGSELDLSLLCRADMPVEATAHFASQILADLLGEEQILALIPGADPESPFEYASEWLQEHAAEVIDVKSLVLDNEVNHPPDPPSYHQLKAALRARYSPRWALDPLGVVREVATEMGKLNDSLEFGEAPELYTTGPLDDLLEELVSVQLASLPDASASLRFRVRDPRWIQHLKAGDELGSTASP